MTSYRLYRNVDGPFFKYEPGQRLWFDATEFEVDAEGEDALGAIFARHNRDDRPDGSYAPSLSVGDVVALDWATADTRFYSVDSFGWTEVEGPMYDEVDSSEDMTHDEALRPYVKRREREYAEARARREAAEA